MKLVTKLTTYARSRRLKASYLHGIAMLLAAALPLLMSVPTTIAEGSISFQLKAYGGNRTVVIFSGSTAEELGAVLDPLGTSIRISAVGNSFSASSDVPKNGLIAFIQQVSRSGYDDLVITLKQPSTMTESRSDGMLKLFISAAEDRSKNTSRAQEPADAPSEAAQTEIAQKAVAPAISLPVRFFTKGIPTDQNQIIVAFPTVSSDESPAFVATLQGVSYFAGLMNAWLTDKEFKIERPIEGKSSEEGEALIEALTAEVVDLRKQLNRAQQNLKKLNGAAPALDVK
jgi:hypothetical protein